MNFNVNSNNCKWASNKMNLADSIPYFQAEVVDDYYQNVIYSSIAKSVKQDLYEAFLRTFRYY